MSDDLDGVIAAPDHHKVIFENDTVRVLETRIPAGDVTPVHHHLARTVSYVVSGSHFVRRDPGGAVLLDTRADPSHAQARVRYTPGLPAHTLENTGDEDLVIIGVELKDPS